MDEIKSIEADPNERQERDFNLCSAPGPGREYSGQAASQQCSQDKSNPTRRNREEHEHGKVTVTGAPFYRVDLVRDAQGGAEDQCFKTAGSELRFNALEQGRVDGGHAVPPSRAPRMAAVVAFRLARRERQAMSVSKTSGTKKNSVASAKPQAKAQSVAARPWTKRSRGPLELVVM